jgi:hypothetical protein
MGTKRPKKCASHEVCERRFLIETRDDVMKERDEAVEKFDLLNTPDLAAPEHGVDVGISVDRKKLWVNRDGVCVLRIQDIPVLEVESDAVKEQERLRAKLKQQSGYIDDANNRLCAAMGDSETTGTLFDTVGRACKFGIRESD